jgi:hypothetical protein
MARFIVVWLATSLMSYIAFSLLLIWYGRRLWKFHADVAQRAIPEIVRTSNAFEQSGVAVCLTAGPILFVMLLPCFFFVAALELKWLTKRDTPCDDN